MAYKYINKIIYLLKNSSGQYKSCAQFILGEIYFENKYVSQDIEASIEHLINASNLNNTFAQNNLGLIYKNGNGNPKNIEKSIYYFRKAIQVNNDPYALYNLAKLYYFGIDIQKDTDTSIDLLKKASEKQLLLANIFLFFIFTNQYDIQKAKHYELIIKKNCNSGKIYNLISSISADADICNVIYCRLYVFLENYDLRYTIEKTFDFDFCYFMVYGSFYKSEKKRPLSKLQDINHEFYAGLSKI